MAVRIFRVVERESSLGLQFNRMGFNRDAWQPPQSGVLKSMTKVPVSMTRPIGNLIIDVYQSLK